MASGLSKENQEKQVNTLLYCLGEEADNVLISTNISEESRKKYDDILAKFDAHFKVHKDIIFKRAQFNRRRQEDDKSVDQFIMSLYSLAENCEFGSMRRTNKGSPRRWHQRCHTVGKTSDRRDVDARQS